MCAAVSVMDCYNVGCGREILMCAVFSVMDCYRAGEKEGNVNMCCSQHMVCYMVGAGGKWRCLLYLALWFVTGRVRKREKVMCAAVIVNVFTRWGV